MAENEIYDLRLCMPLKAVCLLFFFVQLWIVFNGPNGYHPSKVEALWPFMYWFFLITLPLSMVFLLFIPWTVRIRVTHEGIYQSFYVGAGPFKLWQKTYALRWSEVDSVKTIKGNTLASSSTQSVHFIGCPRDKLFSIGISSSYSGGYREALAYALRHVRHADIEEDVQEFVDA